MTRSEKKSLLVLDDDPAIGQLICAIVNTIGVEVEAVHKAEFFFARLEDWHPECVLVDLVMPGVDGVEVIAELAQLNFQGRLILMSGLGGRSLDAAGRMATDYGLNFAGALNKPFTPATLRELVAAQK